MPGRYPSMDPVRRNARVGPLMLPAKGRTGAPPAWPLPRAASAVEKKVWAKAWATPQAVAWENLGWIAAVGRYCRLMVEADQPGAASSLLGELRQLEDRLGLTPVAMRRLLWVIAPDEVAAKRDESKAQSARQRLRAVDSA